MMGGAEMPVVSVGLTKQQIEASPEARRRRAVVAADAGRGSTDHYGWDRYWGDTYFGPDAIDPLSKPIRADAATRPAAATGKPLGRRRRIRTCAASPR